MRYVTDALVFGAAFVLALNIFENGVYALFAAIILATGAEAMQGARREGRG